MNTILCNYNRLNWASWQKQITLRLIITTPNSTAAWEALLDVASSSTTVN
ncbi:hypothetical protein [Xenorhabdus sp. SGI246]